MKCGWEQNKRFYINFHTKNDKIFLKSFKKDYLIIFNPETKKKKATKRTWTWKGAKTSILDICVIFYFSFYILWISYTVSDPWSQVKNVYYNNPLKMNINLIHLDKKEAYKRKIGKTLNKSIYEIFWKNFYSLSLFSWFFKVFHIACQIRLITFLSSCLLLPIK